MVAVGRVGCDVLHRLLHVSSLNVFAAHVGATPMLSVAQLAKPRSNGDFGGLMNFNA